jgi:uncharacterized protein (DUF849 family)
MKILIDFRGGVFCIMKSILMWRFSMTRQKPLILSTALTGVRFSPWRKDDAGNDMPIASTKLAAHMPVTPEQIERDASDAYYYGARFIHVHARNPQTGEQFSSLEYYKDITQRIRKSCPGSIISYPTSRKGEVEGQIAAARAGVETSIGRALDANDIAYIEFAIRPLAMESYPDTITSFTVPEMKMFGTPKDTKGLEEVAGWTDPKVMQIYYRQTLERAKALGVNQEIEVQTLGQFDIMEKLYDFGGMDGPVHLVLLPGFSAGFPIDRDAYETALEGVDKFRKYTGLPVTVTCGAVIPPPVAKTDPLDDSPHRHDYQKVFSWIAKDNRVDVFRVGVEDTPVLYGRQQTNTDLVIHARELCSETGIDVIKDPGQVRKIFGFSYKAPGSSANQNLLRSAKEAWNRLADPEAAHVGKIGKKARRYGKAL